MLFLSVELSEEILMWIQYLPLPFFLIGRVISKYFTSPSVSEEKERTGRVTSIFFFFEILEKSITYCHSPT